MAIAEILKEIDAEIARLQEVRKLLSNTSRAAANGFAVNKSATLQKTRRKKRTLSPEGRKRIADAQTKRWAARKVKK